MPPCATLSGPFRTVEQVASSTDTPTSGRVGWRAVTERVAEAYRPDGRFAHGYVRGKLLADPVYAQLAARAPFAAPLVDLGCGRGQTLLLLAALGAEAPRIGLDWDAAKLARARRAAEHLGTRVDLRVADLRDAHYPTGATLFLIDALHYNSREVQDAMLLRAARALLPGGRLFVREVDSAAGWRAHVNAWQERLGCWMRLNRGTTLCFRPARELTAVMEQAGLETHVVPSHAGTPLANVLIEGRKPA